RDAELDRIVVRGESSEAVALVQEPVLGQVPRGDHVVELTGALLRRFAWPVDVGARSQLPGPDEGGRVPVEVAHDGVVVPGLRDPVRYPVHQDGPVVAGRRQPAHGPEDRVPETHAERTT